MERYEVIVIGASFAGLSVASQLRGKVLLIDKHDIGTFQISACGAPYDIVKEIGCEEAVLQISDTFSFHVDKKRIDVHLERPYCTFNFSRFCHAFNSRNGADLFKAKAIGIQKEGGQFTINTSKGNFSSKGSAKNNFTEFTPRFGSDLFDPKLQNHSNSGLFRRFCD